MLWLPSKFKHYGVGLDVTKITKCTAVPRSFILRENDERCDTFSLYENTNRKVSVPGSTAKAYNAPETHSRLASDRHGMV